MTDKTSGGGEMTDNATVCPVEVKAVYGDVSRRIELPELIRLIQSAACGTMNATKAVNGSGRGSGKGAAATERAGFRRLFKYIVGRFPTESELDKMIPG
jgi:hypothetical protein